MTRSQSAHTDAAATREHEQAVFRARIQQIGTRLTLPLARRALGLLEGEHGSNRPGNGFDFLDLRDYASGDSARQIDWKASAKNGRPIVINRQRDVTSTAWLLLDTGDEMQGTAEGGERLIDVAANALRAFALLSLRRSDEISLVLGDAGTITRTPFSGGYAKFDHTLADAVAGINPAPRDLTALLRYAQKIPTQDNLVIIATAQGAVRPSQERLVTALSEDHALVFVTISPINPFDPEGIRAVDAQSGRSMPAFLRTESLAQDVRRRRDALDAAFRRQLERHKDTLVTAGSSTDLLDRLIRLLSTGMAAGLTGNAAPGRAGSLSVTLPARAKEVRA